MKDLVFWGKGLANLKLEDGKASDSSDLDAGKASDGRSRSKVVRKSKKQLRQLRYVMQTHC